MNIALEQTEELVQGVVKNQYGGESGRGISVGEPQLMIQTDAFIRGNNGALKYRVAYSVH